MSVTADEVGRRMERAAREVNVGAATFDFEVILRQRPNRRIRSSVMSLVAALHEEQSIDNPVQVTSRERVAMLLSDNDHASFASLRQRQVNLLEVVETIRRMPDAKFASFDVAAHLSLADALVRYTNAWTRFYLMADRRLDTNVDLEAIDATLADVLAIAAIGFGITMTGVTDSQAVTSTSGLDSILSTALHDLDELRRRERSEKQNADIVMRVEQDDPKTPLERYGKALIEQLRTFIEVRLGLSVSDFCFFALVGVDALDATLPVIAETSILQDNAYGLSRWLSTGPATVSVATPSQLSALARTTIYPYSVTKFYVGGALATAVRYVASSPLGRASGLESLTDDAVLFAFPLWQLLVVLRLFYAAWTQSWRARAFVGAAKTDAATAYLQRRVAIRFGQKPVTRAAISSADFGSSSSDDEK